MKSFGGSACVFRLGGWTFLLVVVFGVTGCQPPAVVAPGESPDGREEVAIARASPAGGDRPWSDWDRRAEHRGEPRLIHLADGRSFLGWAEEYAFSMVRLRWADGAEEWVPVADLPERERARFFPNSPESVFLRERGEFHGRLHETGKEKMAALLALEEIRRERDALRIDLRTEQTARASAEAEVARLRERLRETETALREAREQTTRQGPSGPGWREVRRYSARTDLTSPPFEVHAGGFRVHVVLEGPAVGSTGLNLRVQQLPGRRLVGGLEMRGPGREFIEVEQGGRFSLMVVSREPYHVLIEARE